MQRLSENIQLAFLNSSQGTDQGQQRRFARPARPSHDNDFAWVDSQEIVEQNLFAKLAFAKIMLQVFGQNRRFSRTANP